MYGKRFSDRRNYVLKYGTKAVKCLDEHFQSSIKMENTKYVSKFENDLKHHLAIEYLLELNGCADFNQYFELELKFVYGSYAKAARRFGINKGTFQMHFRKAYYLERLKRNRWPEAKVFKYMAERYREATIKELNGEKGNR